MPPSAECLRRIAPAAAMVDDFGRKHKTLTKHNIATYRRPRGISTTSGHISFEFLFIKTFPPDKLHNGFRRGIELRNRIRYVIYLSGGKVLIKRNSKEMWREVVLMPPRGLR
jgi:hypothetical protein